VLPATSLAGAEHIAGSILAALAGRGLQHDASAFGVVTVSMGVACAYPGLEDAPETLIARADAALYAAKRSGRNRIHVAEAVKATVAAAGDVVLTSPPEDRDNAS
jgi:diguanylate cyclase (GGDEF)-like protein